MVVVICWDTLKRSVRCQFEFDSLFFDFCFSFVDAVLTVGIELCICMLKKVS